MKKTELPIGVFDSGLGGLTVVKQLYREMPREDFIYLGDTARVPYGTKSPETVTRFALEDTRFLLSRGVKAVVVACNSASAWGLGMLQRRFTVPVFGVILPGVEAAVGRTKTGRVGVMGTRATIRSGAYGAGIRERLPGARVFSCACPLLVPLVEEAWTGREVTLAVLRTYLAPLARRRVDTLILGCTHYPLLKRAIRRVMGRDVALVDSAVSCAAHVRRQLERDELLVKGRRRAGVIQPFVTDEAQRFQEFSARFLGLATRKAVQVDLDVGATVGEWAGGHGWSE